MGLLFLPITGKLSVDPETRPSSCGILWLSANTPSKRRVTLNGFLALGSPPTTRTPSLFLAAGTDMSRSGIGQLQAQDQPHRTHRILEHRNHVSRWFFVCLRRQGRQ